MGPLLALLAACVDPIAHGARVDDGANDTPAVQAAIDRAAATGADVCLPPGVLDLAPTPGRPASLLIDRPVSVRGSGARSVLRLSGDGGQRDWRGIQVRGAAASGVVLRDFAIDALGARNSEEQTHLVEIYQARDVLIAGVAFGPMRRADQAVGAGAGGDCLRIAGEPGSPTDGVVVYRATFTDCDRSAIGIQRAVQNVALAELQLQGTGDTTIDFEPTGAAGVYGDVFDVSIDRVRAARPPTAQGAWNIVLTGSRLSVTGSDLTGGGIGMGNAEHVVIARNQIAHGPQAKLGPTISLWRRAHDVRISDNEIVRPADAVPAPVIRVSHNNAFVPERVQIERNRIVQETAAPIIEVDSASRIAIRDNQLAYRHADRAPYAIDLQSGVAEVGDIDIADNAISGAAQAALRMAARRTGFARVAFDRNKLYDLDRTIVCQGPESAFASGPNRNRKVVPLSACAVASPPVASP